MYKDIEKIYKKKSPYNIIIKKNIFNIYCVYLNFINFQLFQ